MGRPKGQKDIDWADQRKQITRYLKQGLSRTEIATRLGITNTTLTTRLREMGALDPERVAAGKKGQEKRRAAAS